MAKDKAYQLGEKLLAMADIKINGDRPWDMQVHNDKLFERIFAQGSLGVGESYMDGWWDAEKLDEFIDRLLRAEVDKKVRGDWRMVLAVAGQVLLNPQRKSKSFEVGEQHYDVGNDLYRLMLDKRLAYSCGYWENARNLDEAQEAKLDLICRKVGLKPGQRILDIGCGWGSFAKFAAEKYSVSVVGVTVSKEQVALGKELCKGLPVEFILQDYRDIQGQFDHIISIGMFEHVGYKNYRKFMQVAHDHLKDGGLFLLHTIGTNESVKTLDPWVEKYIFTNSLLPSVKYIGGAMEKLFRLEDWHSFGTDYDKTLMVWFDNFDKAWPVLKEKYSGRFYRMWKFYLLVSAATFRCRNNQLWQIVMSKKGVPGGYAAVR
jgi:cyclopropane-fatty-acyl-phospholipid synthase